MAEGDSNTEGGATPPAEQSESSTHAARPDQPASPTTGEGIGLMSALSLGMKALNSEQSTEKTGEQENPLSKQAESIIAGEGPITISEAKTAFNHLVSGLQFTGRQPSPYDEPVRDTNMGIYRQIENIAERAGIKPAGDKSEPVQTPSTEEPQK